MLSIRAATLTDIPALAHLWYEKTILQADRRVKLAPDAREAWAAEVSAWVADSRCVILAAERDGVLIGYAVGWLQPMPGVIPSRIGLIAELAVDAHGYHGGVGRALVDALRAWFSQRGVDQLAVWSPRYDAVGQAFWRSLGAAEWVDVLWIKS